MGAAMRQLSRFAAVMATGAIAAIATIACSSGEASPEAAAPPGDGSLLTLGEGDTPWAGDASVEGSPPPLRDGDSSTEAGAGDLRDGAGGELSEAGNMAGDNGVTPPAPEDDAGAMDEPDASDDGSSAREGESSAKADSASSEASAVPWPTMCGRLPEPTVSARIIALAYEADMYRDCRVKWFTTLYTNVDERGVFLEDLVHWSLGLWGCLGEHPNDFALLHRAVALSSVDAATLIDHYVVSVDDTLALSPGEGAALRGALATLAAPLVSPAFDGYSHPACAVDAGSDVVANDAARESSVGTDAGPDGAADETDSDGP